LKNHRSSKPEQIKDEPSEAVAELEEPMKVEENPKAKSKPDNFMIVHLFPVVNIFEAIDRRRIFQSHNTKEKYKCILTASFIRPKVPMNGAQKSR
jgi:hypothetical protein